MTYVLQHKALDEMTPDEKLELALQAKNRGNCLYKEDDFAGAVEEYSSVGWIVSAAHRHRRP